jgi:phytoene synthase
MSDDPTDLDALIRRVDPDRWLSSRFIADADKRADVLAIYAYDHELARAPKVASNPILGEIRLTWWGEVLDEIFEDRAVRRHPSAQALALAVRRRSLTRPALETMIEARYPELDGPIGGVDEALAWARGTGGAAAALAAHVLDPEAQGAEPAGAAWALSRRAAAEGELQAPLRAELATARQAARRLSVAAFPAVAHAVFALERAAGGVPSGLRARLRVTLAVATGRI